DTRESFPVAWEGANLRLGDLEEVRVGRGAAAVVGVGEDEV
ncbi:MAG: hypothetical protein AVDCRST_MAG64-4108, partial [uncultured Phycisphaerae bacterium]